jgi:glycerol uptake facilitator-like aquaporin
MLLQVPVYILAHFLGSVAAAAVLQALTDDAEASLTVPYASTAEAFIVELILGFNLMFVATAVSTGANNVHKQT